VHRNLKAKHFQKIAKLANIGKVIDVRLHSEIVQNYYDEPQEYTTIHLQTQKDKLSPCTTYVFDSLGLINVIVNGKKLDEKDEHLNLFVHSPELINVENAFNSIMLEVNKKAYFHQSTFFRNFIAQSIDYSMKKIMDDINELNFTQSDPFIREEKIKQLIKNHNELKLKKEINFNIINHINEVYNSNEKR